MIPKVTHRPDGWVEVRFPYRRDVVDDIKHLIPSEGRTWDPKDKCWTVSGPWISTVISLLREAYGDVRIEPLASAPPPAPIRQTDHDYAALHLLPSAPPELIEAAFRCLCRLHHPDRGGDTERMVALNAAMATLRDRMAS